MTLAEARTECERWLAYLAQQETRAIAMQKLASERRRGACSDAEVVPRLAAIDRDITVYDGARLADAVRVMLKQAALAAKEPKP